LIGDHIEAYNLPLTHCYQEANFSPKVSLKILAEESFLKMAMVNNNFLIRLCGHNENPEDLFFQMIGPLLLALIILTILSSLCLQALGNHFTLFKVRPNSHTIFLNSILRYCDKKIF